MGPMIKGGIVEAVLQWS